MKNVKRIVLTTMVIAGLASFACAQNGKGYGPGNGEGYQQQRMANLEKLDLSDEQKQDFIEINKKYAEKGADLRKQKDEEIKELLTEEQYTTYLEMRNNRRNNAGMNRHNMECIAQLNLTDEQKPQFREISRKYGQMAMDLRANGKSREESKKAFEKIRNEKNKEMKTLLSEEQYKTYLEVNNDCPSGKMGYGRNKQKSRTY